MTDGETTSAQAKEPTTGQPLQEFRTRLDGDQCVGWKRTRLDWNLVATHLIAAHGPVSRLYSIHEFPDGTKGFLKIYLPRAKHSVLRRLKKSRAMKEGPGYLTFAKSGIATPPLLAFGETRRGWLWTKGFVLTGYCPSATVAEEFAKERTLQILERAMGVLIRIHHAGLVHGDPRLRNFLVVQDRILSFDLCSWGALTEIRRRQDLIKFLGSALTITDQDPVKRLLQRYVEEVPQLSHDQTRVLEEATAYAAREKVP